jgi:hypothetical protein
MRPTLRAHIPALLVSMAILTAPAVVCAQAGALEEVAPLQCGWRTDRVAVHVGEHLHLTLTCAAAATSTATVQPDWDQLQPDVVDLAPFEVISGTRAEDVLAQSRRYSQFEYVLRLTGEEFFGRDVPLPPLEIPFSIAVGPAGGTVQMGRERTYVLPALPLKILSLAPGPASDIEEVAAHSFAAIESRQGRAALATLVGGGLLAAGGLCVLLFLASVWRSLRARRVRPAFRVADWRIVAGCHLALRRLSTTASREGWTDARLGEALAMLRTLGALAVGLPPRQRLVERRWTAGAGEWRLRRWSFRRPAVAFSASVTPATLRARAAQGLAMASDAAVEAIAAAVAACSDIRYARDTAEGQSDDARAEAGGAVEAAVAVSRELLLRASLPASFSRATRHAPAGRAAAGAAWS